MGRPSGRQRWQSVRSRIPSDSAELSSGRRGRQLGSQPGSGGDAHGDTRHAGGDCHLWRLAQVKGSQAGHPLGAQCCGVRALGGAQMTSGGPPASTGTEVWLLVHRGGARKLALAGAGGPVPGDFTSGGLTSPLTRPSPRPPARSAARTPRLTPVSPPLPCTQPAPPSELSPRGLVTPAAVGPGDPGGWRANTSCRR